MCLLLNLLLRNHSMCIVVGRNLQLRLLPHLVIPPPDPDSFPVALRKGKHTCTTHPIFQNIQEDVSMDAEISNGDNQRSGESPSVDKVEVADPNTKADSRKGELSTEVSDMSKSDQDHASDTNNIEERAAHLEDSDQVPTFAIHEKSSLQAASGQQSSNREVATSEPTELHELPHTSAHGEVLMNGDIGSPESRKKVVTEKHGGKGSSTHVGNRSLGFGQRSQVNNFQRAAKMSVTSGENELSRFSDTPGDASLDDLFHPLDKHLEDRAAEASTSASTSTSYLNEANASVADAGKNDLATKLRATIAQKQMENEMEQANGGGDLLRLIMGVVEDNVMGIESLVFDDRLPGENLFPLQAPGTELEHQSPSSTPCLALIALLHNASLSYPNLLNHFPNSASLNQFHDSSEGNSGKANAQIWAKISSIINGIDSNGIRDGLVLDVSIRMECGFDGVYGPNLSKKRQKMWAELAGLINRWDVSWCLGEIFEVIKDFNGDKLPGPDGFPMAFLGDSQAKSYSCVSPFFLLKAVEFSRLVASLRPDVSEDVIVSACQKLIAIFHQRPEQKIVFVTQHGLLPLMELLDISKTEVSKTRVICAVLQIINQIIKDNTDFQENACLVGLIPLVMSFAVHDRPREVRMEAANFLQQLCQSSSLTLQMFIACRGIPVLVGFLEADYAKYREMVHLAIDGMWQVFKLQRSTPRNDFCRIAAKNGILQRLINTLYSLNEATRLASVSVGAVDGSTQRPRSGQLDSSHPISVQCEAPVSTTGQYDLPKVRHGIIDHMSTGMQEASRASTSHSQRSDPNQSDSRYLPIDPDRPQSSNAAMEASVASKLPDPASSEKVTNLSIKEPLASTSKERDNLDRWKIDPSRTDVDFRQQRIVNSANRTSTDRPLKLIENASNGFPTTVTSQQEQVRPLLSLLDKEPPSRRFSGQLDYVRHLPGLERHESVLPLLHASNEKKTNGDLDFLMAEFADVSQRGRENGNLESSARVSLKTANKKVGPLASNEGPASTSGIVSQTASGVLSGSGVLNARPGSATSSGLLSHMVSTLNADVAREYLGKVSDLLLEFAQADTVVKSFMCSQSLLSCLFQMFNRVEPPILLKILKCINHLSTDPNCLENLQRAEAMKYLIPNLELKEGSLVSQIHHEVLNALFNLCKINKRRQEQAAENGIIPHLMQFIMLDSPLKQYALPLLCDMAHASRNSREQLRAHGGLDVYLSLLEDEFWSVTALDSIAVCLALDNDNKKVEQALLKKDAVQKLVKFFQRCPEQHFVHILEPFLKMITKSSRINTTLAVNGLTPLLIARLDHQDAIARLNLLKLIKAVYEHHPRPKQLIVENDLPQKLQNLIEERRDGQSSGGQVLVKQMATSLLKALHINTVL
uniref:MAP3K epsilon protein kinase 1 n=1 Tax=Quercus lobata TaxID=97700 RepID=A0A7N2L791_QUELO